MNRARAALDVLALYTRHARGCPAATDCTADRCTCGLDAALAEASTAIACLEAVADVLPIIRHTAAAQVAKRDIQ